MLIKCKMCGFDIEVNEDQSICECEFCHSKQTIPTLDNDDKIGYFNRANLLRIRCEYDKAIEEYDSLIQKFPNDPEAYWGKCLSKYGIEYVDDPKTNSKIPTCHRTRLKSILKDEDYLKAIETSNEDTKAFYEKEATEIDRLQKEILKISNKEEPYDIFICYKETDNNGDRTPDSVIAQEIYDKLVEKGYKVFFSRRTLEKELGQEYEPIIFAALKSAKVMLTIGTGVENFNSIWVKNEWSRYLEMMENDSSKNLIPCYKNMDVYDMPIEFVPLQSQDLSKVGYMQDLIYGIDKIFNKIEKIDSKESNKEKESSEAIVSNSINILSLLERAQILIEYNEPNKANELLEKVLNNSPKNAKAYVLKLLIELKLTKEEDLLSSKFVLSDYTPFKLAYKFADSEYKKTLDSYKKANENNIQQSETLKTYNEAVALKNNGSYAKALEMFNSIKEIKPCAKEIEECDLHITKFKTTKKWSYNITGKDITNLCYIGDKNIVDIDLEKEFKGYKIVSFASEAFKDCYELRSIVISDGITRITNGIFDNCYSLTSIVLPESITYIECKTFEYCESLIYIFYKGTKEQWDSIDFYSRNYNRLSNISINYDCKETIFTDVKTDKWKYLLINNKIICQLKCLDKSIKTIDISNEFKNYQIASIGVSCFESFNELKSVVVPDGVLCIGAGAFFNCDKLNKVSLPDSIKAIGFKAFYDDYNIKTINLSNDIFYIGFEAFKGCRKLTNINISSKLINIEKRTFANCNSLREIVMPDNIIAIGSEAFSGCINLVNVTLSQNLKTIEDGAFWSCGFEHIDIPKTVTYIGKSAFNSCEKLLDISIPEGIKEIAHHTFFACFALRNIYIPGSLLKIGYRAFDSCRGLSRIYYGGSEYSLKYILVDDDNDCFVNTPVELLSPLTKFNSVETDKWEYVLGEANDIYNLKCLDKYIECADLINTFKGYTIKSIDYCAFLNCRNLVCVTLPSSIRQIRVNSFPDCFSLTNVFYQGSKEELDKLCKFKNGYVEYDSKVTSIDVIITKQWQYVLANDNLIYGLKCLDKNMELIDLVNSFENCIIKEISSKAFEGCNNLKNIFLPNTIESIADDAFEGCNDLSVILYNGNQTNLNKLVNNKKFKNLCRCIDINKKVNTEIDENKIYENALKEMKEKNYNKAISLFVQIIRFNGSLNQLSKCFELLNKEKDKIYKKASTCFKNRQFEEAMGLLKDNLDDSKFSTLYNKSKNASIKNKESIYKKALDYIENEQFANAIECLKEINGYKDSNELFERYSTYLEDNYNKALRLRRSIIPSRIDEAISLFELTENYKQSNEYAEKTYRKKKTLKIVYIVLVGLTIGTIIGCLFGSFLVNNFAI